MTTAQATDNATDATTNTDADTRRITEQDSDYQRCLRVTLTSLRRSLKVFVAELRAGDAGATSRFIHRHTDLLREAYTRAHAEGQHDYWQHLTNEEPAPQEPDEQQVRQRLSWYALASVLKMAHEGQSHVRHTPRAQIATTARLASEFDLFSVDDRTLQLFNPNHGKDGKFAPGGAGPATSSGVKHSDGGKAARYIEGFSHNNVAASHENFSGADLRGVHVDGMATFRATGMNKQFSDCNFTRADLEASTFNHVNFSHCTFNNALLEQAEFTECTFEHCDFTRVEGDAAHFSTCSFRGTTFEHASLLTANFHAVSIAASSSFAHSLLEGSTFEKSSIRSTDFSHAYLTNAHFLDTRVTESAFTHTSVYNLHIEKSPHFNQSQLLDSDPQKPDNFGMYHERAWRQRALYLTDLTQSRTFAADGTPSDSEFLDSLDNRVVLQANITWPGMQDGYSDAGASDSASPYTEIYWNLEPVKTQHCGDCPQVAGNSPYDPPWGGPIGRQLNQTPGDGRTECGAGCHCDLSYTFPTDAQMHELAGATGRTWNGFAPDGTNMPTSVPMPTKGQRLNTTMIAAMDTFRSAWDQWEDVRGHLPNAPTMFGTNYNGEELPPLDTLSPEQQIIILQMQGALWSWVEAYEASDASENDTGDDTGSDDGTTLSEPILLYNNNHDNKGRFTYGSGGFSKGYSPEHIAHGHERLEQARKRARNADARLTQEHQRIRTQHNVPTAITPPELHDAQFRAARREYDNAIVALRQVNAETVAMHTAEETDAVTEHIFGRTLSEGEFRQLVGAPRLAHVTVSTDGEKLLIHTEGKAGRNATFFTDREVYKQGDKIILHNDYFMIDGRSGKGFGTKVFADQVAGARALGVSKIVTLAARQEGVFNGYYTWPRLGYDASLPRAFRATLANHPTYNSYTRVSQFMSTPGGRNWWKSFGIQMDMSFNLREGSRSSRVLKAYIASKADKADKANKS